MGFWHCQYKGIVSAPKNLTDSHPRQCLKDVNAKKNQWLNELILLSGLLIITYSNITHSNLMRVMNTYAHCTVTGLRLSDSTHKCTQTHKKMHGNSNTQSTQTSKPVQIHWYTHTHANTHWCTQPGTCKSAHWKTHTHANTHWKTHTHANLLTEKHTHMQSSVLPQGFTLKLFMTCGWGRSLLVMDTNTGKIISWKNRLHKVY